MKRKASPVPSCHVGPLGAAEFMGLNFLCLGASYTALTRIMLLICTLCPLYGGESSLDSALRGLLCLDFAWGSMPEARPVNV